jgi:hypothetical protein
MCVILPADSPGFPVPLYNASAELAIRSDELVPCHSTVTSCPQVTLCNASEKCIGMPCLPPPALFCAPETAGLAATRSQKRGRATARPYQ